MDVLNSGIYRAVRDGYLRALGDHCYALTETGLVRARVLAVASGIDPDDWGTEDATAEAISLVAYGFIYVSK